MKNIKQSYLINASPADVWRALTEPEFIEEWSGADAEYEPTVGTEYSLWDGSITGEILAVVPHKKLAQTWKPDDWEIQDSVVTFTLKPVGDKTRVDLVHENVEEFDYEGTSEGWDLYYLGAIKRMLDARAPRKVKPRNAKLTKKPKAAKGKLGAKRKPAKKTARKKK